MGGPQEVLGKAQEVLGRQSVQADSEQKPSRSLGPQKSKSIPRKNHGKIPVKSDIFHLKPE